MMKKFVLLSLMFVLYGCANSASSNNPPTQQEQLCRELKRNLIFNATSGPSFGQASEIQRANMMRLYDKYNCGKLEKTP